MRTFAGFCITASLLAAPAFAQTGAFAQTPAAAAPSVAASKGSPLTASSNQPAANAAVPELSNSRDFSLGVVDRLTIKRGLERSLLSLSPVESDQLALSWRPAGKWGIMLDMTSRSKNDVLLPKEELSAGAYYQVSPRFRFGGGVTLNGEDLGKVASGRDEKKGETEFRIESAFSF